MVYTTFVGWKNRAEPDVHYIPKDFRGSVFIIFNRKDGNPKEYDEKGRRVYRIPESGILKTQFAPNFGTYNSHMKNFYLVTEDNRIVKKMRMFTEMHRTDTVRFADIIDSVTVKAYSFAHSGRRVSDSLGVRYLQFDYTSYLVKKYGEKMPYPKFEVENMQ